MSSINKLKLYSKYNIPYLPIPPILHELMTTVSDVTGSVGLNSINANLYYNGANALGWHADNEQLFQAARQYADIVSISLGATRTFLIRQNSNMTEKPIQFSHGDILTMEGLFQKFFQHCLPPSACPVTTRINLTLRKIVQHTEECPIGK